MQKTLTKAPSYTVQVNHWMKPIPVRDFDYIARLDDGDLKYWGSGRYENQAILDLLQSLFGVEKFDDCSITVVCPTCSGEKYIEVLHHAYGSHDCPEPWEDIQCPTCKGKGELTSDVETLIGYFKEEVKPNG